MSETETEKKRPVSYVFSNRLCCESLLIMPIIPNLENIFLWK